MRRVDEERARGIAANIPIPNTDLELVLEIFTICLIIGVGLDFFKRYFQWKIATTCYSICPMTIVAVILLVVIVPAVKEKVAAAIRNQQNQGNQQNGGN
ncbi:hypothetical protein OROMI_010438 [Orobanche minor]